MCPWNYREGNSDVDYEYDRIGRLDFMTHAFAGGAGNVTLDVTRYNPANQIDTRTRNNDDYAWNGGEDLSRNYSVNGLNQYTAAGGTTFSYDDNGNLIRSGSTSYVYDVENRLVAASGGHTARLVYDPLGRLFEVTGTSTPRRFLWDGDALVAEYTSTDSLGARFVHGTAEGVDDPLVWYGGGENRRLHADHQGSIVAITDGTGAIKWINGYDEWGIPNAPNNTGRFQYTGQLWIGELGMYHYKARIYSSTLGRFLQVDPVGYEDQINLYAYVRNDPVNSMDPSGKAGCGTRAPGGDSASCPDERDPNHTFRNTLAAAGAVVGGVIGGGAGGAGGAVVCSPGGPAAAACAGAGGAAGAAGGAVIGGAIGALLGEAIDQGIALFRDAPASAPSGRSGRGGQIEIPARDKFPCDYWGTSLFGSLTRPDARARYSTARS